MTVGPACPGKTLVKVGVARGLTYCRRCGAPVEQYLTITRPRVILFNAGAPIVRASADPVTQVPVWYLDRADAHPAACQDSPPPRSAEGLA